MGSACKERVYLDHAATTPLSDAALDAMRPYLQDVFGNANGLYREGREAYAALEDARKQVAGAVGARRSSEIVFTSGGTESDNAALIGIASACLEGRKGGRVIISSFEHHAVLECIPALEHIGCSVDLIEPGADGFIRPSDLAMMLDDDVVLVSIMYANNEIGTVQPVRELAAASHEVGACFHTDAVQALGKLSLDLEGSGIDAASFSAHKAYGPKGVGALYLRRRTPFRTQMRGGGQEGGRRSGTQNVAGAAGFAAALDELTSGLSDEIVRERVLRDRLLVELPRISSRIRLTVDPLSGDGRYLPNLVSFCIEGMESETALVYLDEAGIALSGGSACSSRSLEPSHVLLAIGCERELAFGSLRVSLGRATMERDIDVLLEKLDDLMHDRTLS